MSTRLQILAFMRDHPIAVAATVTDSNTPEAAAVGVAVRDDFELVFDTLESTRKYANLQQNPAIAFVFGSSAGDEATVQYEGVSDVPTGEDGDVMRQYYLDRFPDGVERLAWAGIVHVRVRPRWIRWSDYRTTPPEIIELEFQ